MNFLSSLANIGKAAVEAADRRTAEQQARKAAKGAPGCTPCAALGYVVENKTTVAQYSARKPAAKRKR